MTASRTERLCALLCYRFNDEALLEAAFTHSSFVNEHVAVSNERLEFLGDCVLNFLVGLELFERDEKAAEGKLSARRAALVSRAPLARLVEKYGYLEYLKTGAGVDKGAFSDKARSDLFEAIVGAIYLDGGMDAASGFLKRTFFEDVKPEKDYKSELQALTVRNGGEVVYETIPGASGFICDAKVLGGSYRGEGRTKHAAQIAAARTALEAITSREKS